MTDEMEVPSFVSDDELIARVLLSPYMVDEDEVSHTAFQMRPALRGGEPEDYISVIRKAFIKEITPQTVCYIRKAGNTLYGYVALIVGECRQMSVNDVSVEDVLSYPSKKYPYHAGIHFSKAGHRLAGECREPSFIALAKMLASHSKPVLFNNL